MTDKEQKKFERAQLAANRRYHAKHKKRPAHAVCVICKEPIFGFGHNAAPVKTGRCCDICQDVHVMPARLASMFCD